MTKKDQISFTENVVAELKGAGILLEHFLNAIEMSRTHWFFIKKAERPLTDKNEKKISEYINKRCYSD